MTAINSRNSFVGRGRKLTSCFDGDAADGPSANQKQNENGEFIIDGCQCSPRTEVLLWAGCGPSVRDFVECRAVDFHRNERVEVA